MTTARTARVEATSSEIITRETDASNLNLEDPEVSNEDWASWCETTRAEDPPPAVTIDPAIFLEQEAAQHDDRAQEEGPRGTHRLIAGELRRLAGSVRFYGSKTAEAFVARVPRLSGWDLTRVSIPDHWGWDSKLAVDVLEEALLYATLYHALGSLVGRLLMELAEDVEGYGSATADRYLADLAEAREAAIEAMNSGM